MNREIKVSAKDKKDLQDAISKIKEIVDKYPWFSDDDIYFCTTMNRIKTASADLKKYIELLDIKE